MTNTNIDQLINEKGELINTVPIVLEISGLTTSLNTSELDVALAKAQGEIALALKDSINPHFKSKYADIASTIEVLRKPLSQHGIAVTQWPIGSTDDRLHLLTRLSHKGQFMQATFSAPVTKKDPQGYGSAMTYLRRYSLQSILGVATEDDDGNEASEQSAKSNEDLSVKLKLQDVKATIDQFEEVRMRFALAPLLATMLNDGKRLIKLHAKLLPLINRTNKAVLDANGDPDKIQDVINQVMAHINKEMK